MVSPATVQPNLLASLEEGGYRVTGPRLDVLRLLERKQEGFTSEELCDELPGVGRGVRRQNKWDKRGAFKACNLDANRLRQFSDLPTSVRLDSFASPPVSSPVWRLAVRGTYPPA